MIEIVITVVLISLGLLLGWLKWFVVYRPLLRSLEAWLSESRPQAVEPSKARYVSKIK